jgi:alpha-L-rhamnosidase
MISRSTAVFSRIFTLCLIVLSACSHGAAPVTPSATSTVTVDSLRVESLSAPIGLGTRNPHLGWKLVSSRRGEVQHAYRILVASDRTHLDRNEGDLWDTNKVLSDRQNEVPYAGSPLKSEKAVYWKVAIWDRDDKMSPWSKGSSWEMGLLDPSDWKARWITAPVAATPVEPPMDLSRAQWIWLTGDAKQEFPTGKIRLRRAFEVPVGRKVAHANLFAGVNDTATIAINGNDVLQFRMNQAIDVVDVTQQVKAGKNVISAIAENGAGAAGLIVRLEIQFTEGPPLIVFTDAQWRCVRDDSPGNKAQDKWQEAAFSDRKWSTVRVVSAYGQGPMKDQPSVVTYSLPAPYFRKTFTLAASIVSARLHIAGLGYHDAHINGIRVGDHVLDPSYTAFDKRIEVVAHDVTKLVKEGDNAIGVVVGNGLYHQHDKDAWDFFRAPWRDAVSLLAELHVQYRDGKTEIIATGEDWRQGIGPIVYDGTRHGETYDSQREIPNWASPGADESKFGPVVLATPPDARVVAQEHPPIRVTETRRPATISEVQPGVFSLDAGQNLAGWLRLRVKGPAGTTIKLRYGEKRHPDGKLDRSNIEGLVRSSRFQTDEYILNGNGVESWEPRFTYHGFQYVEITGWPGTPTIDDFDVRVVHSDFDSIGTFESSNDLLNKLQQATRWSYRSNFHSIPTDCPHREKNGWTGDAHLAIATGLFNFDAGSMYRKWVQDLLDSQTEKGDLPGIVPSGGWGLDNWSGPSWEVALFEIPWTMYEMNGDERILSQVFPAWERYLAYADKRSVDGIADFGLGDWVPLKTKTPVAVTSTAMVYRMASLAARVAPIVGHGERTAYFTDMADRIRKGFAKRFIQADTATVSANEQTALAMALSFGMTEGDLYKRIADRLAQSVTELGAHLDTGVIGAKYVPRVLSEAGYPALAYKILAADDFPSWGYWIRQGATTLWEDWKGESSRNHIFFGDLSAWFFDHLAGIQPDPVAPGFAHFFLSPFVPEGLDHASAQFHSIRGTIESRWQQTGDGVQYTFVVPPNSRATIVLFAPHPERVTESKTPVRDSSHVKVVDPNSSSQLKMEVGSGTFNFMVPQ